jgi:hypothetical protein
MNWIYGMIERHCATLSAWAWRKRWHNRANVRRLEVMLCERFGGFTRLDAFGGWRHAGRTFREPMLVYDVALNSDMLDAVSELRSTAATAKRYLRQEAIYLRLPSGDVEFV